MKKILFLLPRLSSGGAERQAVTIAVEMKALGNDVAFFCYENGDFFEKTLIDAGIPVTRRVSNYLRRIFYVVKFIHHGRFDVVISFMPTPNFLNCLAATFGKKWKVFTSERSSKIATFTTKRGRLFGAFQRYSDFIICNSDNARQMWIKYYPKYAGKCKTIYNAVKIPKITTEYIPCRNNRVNIVVAATIYKIKNPMGLLNALLLMSDSERSCVHIDWYGKKEAEIGNHVEYDKVVATIQDKRLQDCIELHDETRDIANKMQESDFVALFSQLEGLPNAICEAMMLGKPIIMTRCSDYNILIEEGVNGFLCDWDNPKTIKDALLKASTVPIEILNKMGEVSKMKAQKLFSKDNVISLWLDLM